MSYRVLARSAPAAFFPLGLLARLPYAITPLGSLLVLQHATGSHSFAGLAAGTQSVAITAAGLVAGGLTTRVGARRLGVTLAVLTGVLVDGPASGLAWFVPAGCAFLGLLVAVRAGGPAAPQVCPPGSAG